MKPPPKSNEFRGQSWGEFCVDLGFMVVVLGVAMVIWFLFR
jgi:hypothetical protein